MANPSRTEKTPIAKQKKRKPTTNWKRVVILSVMALVVVSMAAPGMVRLIGSFGSRGSDSNPPPSNTTASTTTAPPANTETMPEPMFKKEGELYFLSSESGKAITKIDIEKADTDTDRQFGLMFRKSMPEDEGMLFLFDNSEQQSFWMHNTYIPLDIIFVDENNVITTIHENVKPLNDTSLKSNGAAKYVVEVNGGYAKKHGIKVGNKISWQ